MCRLIWKVIMISWLLIVSTDQYSIAQSDPIFQKDSVFIPLLNNKSKVVVNSFKIYSKDNCIQFLNNPSYNYLKFIFSKEKDSIATPLLKFQSSIEIKSGKKSFYKKDWAIYQESNQLFFVLLLPLNYLKTLSEDGITEILVNEKIVANFSKSETNKIKQVANYLIKSSTTH